MTRFQTLLTSALLSLTLTPSAQATTLVDQGIAMRDFATNLLWLDLDQTRGLSPNAALAENPTFRFATLAEVFDLYETAGFDGNFDTPNTANFPAANTLINLLGATDNDNLLGYPRSFGQGWAQNGASFNNAFYEVSFQLAQTPRGRFVAGVPFGGGGNFSASNVGTFLVSQVPLPTTLPLLLSALALIGLQMRGKKRRAAPA